MLRRFMSDTEGVVSMEYGLIAALIAVAIILSLTQTGEGLEGIFRDTINSMDSSI
jgi:pilus assembly protein Flp/PilA